MELIVALVLFMGLITSWLVLPGSSSPTATAEAEPIEATGLGRTTVSQGV